MKAGVILLALALAGCATGPAEPPAPLEPTNPVAMLVRLPVPPEKRTVAEAAEYLLEATPYRLMVAGPHCPPEAQEIAEKPISPLAQTTAITTIKRALLMVAGSRTKLLIDDTAQSVTFAYASHAP